MAEKQKTSWVYTPKAINTRRGLLYGLTDLMGGGWNNIVSGVIFVFVLSQELVLFLQEQFWELVGLLMPSGPSFLGQLLTVFIEQN